MNDRAFYHYAESWYGKTSPLTDCVDDVMFGYYPEGGNQGTTGEMKMAWYALGEETPSPCLEVFCDAWQALYDFRDVLERLAALNNKNITPTEFCALLLELGFTDKTHRAQGEDR